jgi:hypothetical protein
MSFVVTRSLRSLRSDALFVLRAPAAAGILELR